MKVCPKCGFVDPDHWRAKSWHTHSAIEIARVSDLEYAESEFLKRLKDANGEMIEGNYAYKISKTGIWVYRRWVEIWKIQGWKEIPAEKHNPPKHDSSQRRLLDEKTQP